MPILFHVETGQPVLVNVIAVDSFLRNGYRSEPPTVDAIPSNEQLPLEDDSKILINSASLKDLAEQFGLSTAQAKELRDGRPYASIEDLIAKIKDVDWLSLSPKISFTKE